MCPVTMPGIRVRPARSIARSPVCGATGTDVTVLIRSPSTTTVMPGWAGRWPSSRLALVNTVRDIGLPLPELVEPHGVPGDDEIALLLGDAGEVGLDGAPGIRPVRAAVREVAGPHQPLDSHGVAVVHRVVVRDVRVVEVLGDHLAGELLQSGLG